MGTNVTFKAGTGIVSENGGVLTLSGGLATGGDKVGGNTLIQGGKGTGTGSGGSIIFQVADGSGSSGSSANSLATALTIADDKKTSLAGNLELDSDSSTLSFGADQDVVLTHVADTGLLLNSNMKLQFRDSDIHISSDADGYLNVQADTGVNLNIGGTDELAITSSTATFGTNIVIPDAGTIGSATDTDAISISSGGVVNVSATTASSTSTNGALTVGGGLGVAADINVGDDLSLLSDAAVLNFGADRDVTITHVADTGLTFTATTAATSGVKELLNIIHQTSGTPAAGIGTDIAFTVETSDGNNEKGMILEALTTDVSSASEDFDFIVKLMAGGATAAEKMRLTSTGGLRLGASGTTITGFIDEDDMSTDSATLVPTQQSVKAYVDANSGSGAVSAVANGSNNRIATFSSSDALNGEANLTFDGNILSFTSAQTISTCFPITADGISSANVLDISADALTTGSALNITSTSANKSTGALVNFAQTGATTTQEDFTFKVSTTATTNASAGVALFTGDALTLGKAVSISADGLTTGSALDVTSTSSVMSSAKLLNLDHTVSGTGLTAKSSNLAKISSSRTETRTTGTTADDYHLQLLSRTNVMNGLGGTMTSTGSVLKLQNTGTQSLGTLTDTVKGLEVSMGSVGTGTAIDVTHSNSSAIGLQLNCANGSTDIKLLSSADNSDYFSIATSASGATTITTVDDSSAAADLTFTIDGAMKLNATGGILIAERASAATDVASFGQLWVKNNTPNDLYFTNDAGNDVQITNGSSLAGGGGSSTLGGLTDVTMDGSGFTNSLVIQTNSDGSAPTLGSTSGDRVDNIGIGNAVFTALTEGDYNTVVGGLSGDALTSGSSNSLYGYNAGSGLTTGASNVIIGSYAGMVTSDVDNTVLIGPSAGGTANMSSDADGAIAIGYQSGYSLTTGSSNTFIGYSSGIMVSTGNKHTVLGYEALDAEDDGNNSTAIGYQALTAQTGITGDVDNTALGCQAGLAVTSGIQNTCIGSKAGDAITTGDNNTVIGYNAAASSATVDNEFTLGNSSVTALRCADTTIASLSDSRDKTNIVDSPYGLDFVNSLRPVQFTWQRRVLEPSDENHTKNGTTRVGFLAQELQSAMPNNENDVLDLVYESNPDRLEAKYGNLVPILAQAIKDLKAQNDALAARVAALENA